VPCAARKGDEGGITARRRRLRRRRRPPPLDRRGLCAPRSPSRPLLSIALLSAAATRIEAALRAVVHDSTKVGACAAPGLGASIVVDETEELGRRSRSRAIGDASSSSRRPLSLSGCFLASRCVSLLERHFPRGWKREPAREQLVARAESLLPRSRLETLLPLRSLFFVPLSLDPGPSHPVCVCSSVLLSSLRHAITFEISTLAHLES
jgi:hypothetical protein